MSRFKCPTCGGEYEDPQPNGTRYFHECPPVEDRRVHKKKLPASVELEPLQLRKGHRNENKLRGARGGVTGRRKIGE